LRMPDAAADLHPFHRSPPNRRSLLLPAAAGRRLLPLPARFRPTRGCAHKLPGAHTKARVRGRACCVQELLARTDGRIGRELVPAAARASAHVGTSWPDFVPAAFSVRTRSSPFCPGEPRHCAALRGPEPETRRCSSRRRTTATPPPAGPAPHPSAAPASPGSRRRRSSARSPPPPERRRAPSSRSATPGPTSTLRQICRPHLPRPDPGHPRGRRGRGW